ncbi:MAG TPA: UDP-2,3-diacylglucosamine diphosphatase [Casimicrobiaceae bacterium]
MPPSIHPIRVRTLFLSDIHLGMKGCQAHLLLDFLRCHEAETIFLVGDIIEGWRLKSRRPWPLPHLNVAIELVAKARDGTRIVYVPGNHDDVLRDFIGLRVGGIEFVRDAVHEGADGRRYLVTHGDQFDIVMQYARWLAVLGHHAYHALIALNTYVNMARRGLGLNYWSLSAWMKRQVKEVMKFISQFEEKLSAEARRHQAQGVVCGHIHHPADHDLFGVRYINAGDWVESCTGVIEHHDGRFEIVHWVNPAQSSSRYYRDASSRLRDGLPWLNGRALSAKRISTRD